MKKPKRRQQIFPLNTTFQLWPNNWYKQWSWFTTHTGWHIVVNCRLKVHCWGCFDLFSLKFFMVDSSSSSFSFSFSSSSYYYYCCCCCCCCYTTTSMFEKVGCFIRETSYQWMTALSLLKSNYSFWKKNWSYEPIDTYLGLGGQISNLRWSRLQFGTY